MMSTSVAIVCLAAVAIAGAAFAAFRTHVLHAIMGLGACVFGVAGIFIWLGSPFVAAMLVLIYVGGITVAMVFAMMLSQSVSQGMKTDVRKVALAVIAAGAFVLGVGNLIGSTEFASNGGHAPAAWQTARIGRALLEEYNIAFELLSVVLLLAVIGSIAVAAGERPTGRRGSADGQEGAP